MHITHQESHHISVLAGQGETSKLVVYVKTLARRENVSPADVLIACKDDFQQTAAHIAAKAGQNASIETLAQLLETQDKKAIYFNMANRFSGDRPTHTAMRHGYIQVLRTLVCHGADPLAPNRFGDVILDYPGDYEIDEVQAIVDEYKMRRDTAQAIA